MTDSEALALLETILEWDYLNQTQEAIFRQVWDGKSYMEIATSTGYDYGYVKDTGAQLWRRISIALEKKITKTNIRSVLTKLSQQRQPKPVPSAPIDKPGKAILTTTSSNNINVHQSWEERIDVNNFYGRLEEQNILEQWIAQDRCRLISILGIGGVGKTALAAKVSNHLQDSFDYVLWRTLRNASPLSELLPELILFLSDQQDLQASNNTHQQIGALLKYLHQHRCLLVLDNLESILIKGESAGRFRVGYEDYGDLICRIADEAHQSCLLLTSREKPVGLSHREGGSLPVRVLQLKGIKQNEGREIIFSKGLESTGDECDQLTHKYCGNPLAIKIAAATVQSIFGGNITEFLSYGTLIFGNLWDVLEQQFNRLSELEQKVMYWLAINRDWVTLSELREDIIPTVSHRALLEAVESLKARSLIETGRAGITQQPVVMEYMTERLITQFYAGLNQQEISFLGQYALNKAQSQDYIRESQVRLISKPLLDKLLRDSGQLTQMERQLKELLIHLKNQPVEKVGYAGGNIFNLMCQLPIDLAGQDFSNLPIWQAYLPAQKLHQVNLANADLSKTVFSESFGGLRSVAFSPDGKILATSDANGDIHLWQVSSGKRLRFWKANQGWAWHVAFSPNGQTLASGSDDNKIRIWDVSTGKLLTTLQGHQQRTWGQLDWSSDSNRLVSGGEDFTIRIWDVKTGQCIRVLEDEENPENRIRPVLFMDNETKIISGSTSANIIQVWDIETGQCVQTLTGHQAGVLSLALNSDQRMLASSSVDRTIRLWDLETGNCIQTLRGHSKHIWMIALNHEDNLLASASDDQTVRIWDVAKGQCLRVFQDFKSRVMSISFNPCDSFTLASGSDDQMIRLWDLESGRCLKTLKGYTQGQWAVAFSPDRKTLASGDVEGFIRIWDVATGCCLKSLGKTDFDIHSINYHPKEPILAVSSNEKIYLWDLETEQQVSVISAHKDQVWQVTFSPDGQYLASASSDGTARLWDWQQEVCLQTFEGHHFFVCSSRFSPDGRFLATGSIDTTVKLWNYQTGECLRTLSMEDGEIYQLAFHPDNQMMVCGDTRGRLRIWDLESYLPKDTLEGHDQSIWTVDFSPNGAVFASGGNDQMVKIWDAITLDCRLTLQGHQNNIFSVAFSPDGTILASASFDETVRLWDVSTGKCLKVLRAPRLYEAMNIKGATGLTDAQKLTLQAFGAIR